MGAVVLSEAKNPSPNPQNSRALRVTVFLRLIVRKSDLVRA